MVSPDNPIYYDLDFDNNGCYIPAIRERDPDEERDRLLARRSEESESNNRKEIEGEING